tara:strand:+ start:498 stop:1622 length:1125 start_codon:yes stop_codon:yes gene_type:complete
MAYQNVGTPRFFIDNYIYLRAVGLNPQQYINEAVGLSPDSNENILDDIIPFKSPLDDESLYTLYPQEAKLSPSNDFSQSWYIPCGKMINDMDFSGNMKWYGAILNHNLGNISSVVQQSFFSDGIQSIGNDIDAQYTSVLNAENTSLLKNGTSIWFSDNVPTDKDFAGFKIVGLTEQSKFNDFRVGGISMGVMYTMPHSPDLKLDLDIEFDGFEEIQTIGGSTLININQTGAPVWINDNKYNSPFAVGDFSENPYLDGAKRNGRRTWSLKFSFMSDDKIFASNFMNTNHTETIDGYEGELDENNEFEDNIFTHDSFISQVWNKTLGGALRFIFQPDSENNNPDQFCICKFDQDSVQLKQVAFRTYSFSVKIREVW